MICARIRGASSLVDCLRGYSPVTRPPEFEKEYPRQCKHAFGAKSINRVFVGCGLPALTMTDTDDLWSMAKRARLIESPTRFLLARFPMASQSTISAEISDASTMRTWKLSHKKKTITVGQVRVRS